MSALRGRRIAVVDFEIPPGPRHGNRVTEIGLVVVNNLQIVHRSSAFVHHRRAQADGYELLALEVATHGCDLFAGYGSVERSVLANSVRGFVGDYLDILVLARQRLPRLAAYSLDSVCRALGVMHPGPQHRALPDALAAWECLRDLTVTYGLGCDR